MTDFDAELRRYNDILRAAYDLGPADHVLDVGCGTGQTTRQAARVAAAGRAFGVDISAAAIEQARDRARGEGLDHVAFAVADAQVHPFPAGCFDLAISRFGAMFFADPAAAFANIGQALRPTGRLVMLVWQARQRNAWAEAVQHALEPVATDTADGLDAFSLADPSTLTGLLTAAGFTDVHLTDVHEPVYYGPDLSAALDWVHGFATVRDLLGRLEPTAASAVEDRLAAALAAQAGADGVWFDSRAWLVTAGRRPG